MSDETKKILIVDDDKFLREMYVTKFSASGFKVDSASSVKEAIQKIEEGLEVDLVLFDIVMPLEDGWDFAKQLKDNNYLPKAKKVVLSNQGEETDIEKSKTLDIDGYIVKALSTPTEVVEQVKKITGE